VAPGHFGVPSRVIDAGCPDGARITKGCRRGDGFALCRQLFIELSDADFDSSLNNQITVIPKSFLPGMSASRKFIGLRNVSEVSFAPSVKGAESR